MRRETIAQRLDTLLVPLGFVRERSTWNRRTGAFIDVIEVSRSSISKTMTVNAGVVYPDAYTACWGEELPAIFEEPLCTVRANIGQLIDGEQLWWRSADVGCFGDVAWFTSVHVLPFLERMHSLEAIDAVLTETRGYPPPVIYRAVIKRQLGDKSAACALLSKLHSKSAGAWGPHIAEIAARWGCA